MWVIEYGVNFMNSLDTLPVMIKDSLMKILVDEASAKSFEKSKTVFRPLGQSDFLHKLFVQYLVQEASVNRKRNFLGGQALQVTINGYSMIAVQYSIRRLLVLGIVKVN